eukprot:GHVU01049788.1.p1 GENE.GHVU01049788.1~~GHVU01049788.1.p1  ORF type:complete len:110 (-),score=7.98 GHVU01049788.1:74-403(-)
MLCHNSCETDLSAYVRWRGVRFQFEVDMIEPGERRLLLPEEGFTGQHSICAPSTGRAADRSDTYLAGGIKDGVHDEKPLPAYASVYVPVATIKNNTEESAGVRQTHVSP